MKPTADYLRSILDYEERTGILRWKWRSDVAYNVNRRFAGKIAGTLNRQWGYWQIRINGRIFKNHNVIWAMQTGAWPEIEVDHRNREPQDNRWENLRAATRSQNKANTGKRSHSRQPLKGISKKGNRWRAYISLDGKQRYLGSFGTAEEAHRAYLCAARAKWGEFATAC